MHTSCPRRSSCEPFGRRSMAAHCSGAPLLTSERRAGLGDRGFRRPRPGIGHPSSTPGLVGFTSPTTSGTSLSHCAGEIFPGKAPPRAPAPTTCTTNIRRGIRRMAPARSVRSIADIAASIAPWSAAMSRPKRPIEGYRLRSRACRCCRRRTAPPAPGRPRRRGHRRGRWCGRCWRRWRRRGVRRKPPTRVCYPTTRRTSVWEKSSPLNSKGSSSVMARA